ncbi:MAG: hypothetical protein KME40_16380 [Komarekiella atlantica HA4396-MV6]|nr:hypothetical protein [Komarekiella atlantica HA4396-MV6]
MLPFNKKIITDEAMHPVAVLIDYHNWQQSEKILEEHESEKKEEFDLNKYKGVMKLTQDPLKYQQQTRDKWC